MSPMSDLSGQCWSPTGCDECCSPTDWDVLRRILLSMPLTLSVYCLWCQLSVISEVQVTQSVSLRVVPVWCQLTVISDIVGLKLFSHWLRCAAKTSSTEGWPYEMTPNNEGWLSHWCQNLQTTLLLLRCLFRPTDFARCHLSLCHWSVKYLYLCLIDPDDNMYGWWLFIVQLNIDVCYNYSVLKVVHWNWMSFWFCPHKSAKALIPQADLSVWSSTSSKHPDHTVLWKSCV